MSVQRGLTLREEHRLKVFENRVLRHILCLKGDEVIGEWRKLHSYRLDALYSLPNIIRMIKLRRIVWAGHMACMVSKRGAWCVLVGKPDGRRPLERHVETGGQY